MRTYLSWYLCRRVHSAAARGFRTKRTFLWQVNTALSYGAKGIQYFTGVLPSNGAETFDGAMFDRDGNRTAVYDYVKKANMQLAAADEVLMCSKFVGLIFTGVSPW